MVQKETSRSHLSRYLLWTAVLVIIGFAFALFALLASSSRVGAYDDVQKGMTKEEVHELLGNPDIIDDLPDSQGLYLWDNRAFPEGEEPTVAEEFTYVDGIIYFFGQYRIGFDLNGRVVSKEHIEYYPF